MEKIPFPDKVPSGIPKKKKNVLMESFSSTTAELSQHNRRRVISSSEKKKFSISKFFKKDQKSEKKKSSSSNNNNNNDEEKAVKVKVQEPIEESVYFKKDIEEKTDNFNKKFSKRHRSQSTSNIVSSIIDQNVEIKPKKTFVPKARTNPQFGLSPSELLDRNPDEEVPSLIVACVEILDENLRLEGIFRIPGRSTDILEMKISFEQGHGLGEGNFNPHAVAGLLGEFFRELPEPLLTYGLYFDYIDAAKIEDTGKLLKQMKKLGTELPIANYFILEYFIKFLVRLSKFSGANRMSARNLALVFGASLLNPPSLDQLDLNNIKLQCKVIEIMLTYCDQIFDDAENDDTKNIRIASNVPTIPVQANSSNNNIPTIPIQQNNSSNSKNKEKKKKIKSKKKKSKKENKFIKVSSSDPTKALISARDPIKPGGSVNNKSNSDKKKKRKRNSNIAEINKKDEEEEISSDSEISNDEKEDNDKDNDNDKDKDDKDKDNSSNTDEIEEW